jgi:hypothetical protein
MSEFANVQPDSVEHRGRIIHYCGTGAVQNTSMKYAVVAIDPGVAESPDLVVGHGGNQYEARADAFTRARRFIESNP